MDNGTGSGDRRRGISGQGPGKKTQGKQLFGDVIFKTSSHGPGTDGLKPRAPVDPMQFSDKAIRESWINDKNMLVFSFFDPGNPLMVLDVFIREPFPFEEMIKRTVQMDFGDITVPVCAINDLIEMKKKSGRPKDLEDIKYLESVQNLENED